MGTKFYKARTIYSSSGGRLSETGKILVIFFFLISGGFSVFSQTTPITFTQISIGSTDIIAPGRAAEYWNGVTWTNGSGGGIKVPTGNMKTNNAYYRFDWGVEIETAQGVYNWSKFDQQINSAIDNGQMFSFGLMPMCTACSNTGVSGLTYPLYLHNLMQAEAAGSQDWYYSAGGVWVPNWNSPNYLGRYQALLNAVAAHIASGSHNGRNYKDVIYYVDIRGYGDFGEWHAYPWYGTEPAGRKATSATLKSLIDMNLAAFPNYPNVMMISGFNQGGAALIPADVSYYALTKSNAWGPLGWRRDNWGDPNTDNILSSNTGSYNPGSGSVAFAPLILNRYKTSPVVGEPNNATGSSGAPYADLLREINLYHTTSFGDGNFPNAGDGATQTNIIAASKACGYRLVIAGGNMTTTLTSGGGFNLSLNWQNIGVAPVYENWNVVFELRKSDGTVVWTGNSSFIPKLFLPQALPTIASDNFTLSAVAAGTYSMYLIVRDPANYKAPLPLAVTGRNADGSYLLRSNITIGTGPANIAPTANAGADLNVQLPVSNVSFAGTGNDPDGTISGYSWAKVSGPAVGTISTPTSANTTVTGLAQGVYQYVLTITDNQGANGSDTIQVIVSAAAATNLAPIANAGADLSITLPVSSVTLNGSASSDPDGSITTFLWTNISGPTQFTIGNTATASTIVNNLTAGSYSFQLKVTDNGGATALDTIKVTVNSAPVNQPPVSNAGADQNITLPTNAVTINGSASSDPDGSISAYLWTKISGPAQFTVGDNTSASTLLSNLTAGLYSFQLKVTDNGGAIALDTIKVNVNAAPANQLPVANAGADIAITLPTNIANLDGSGSSDPDGTIASYAWSQVSGPASATISTATAVSTGLTGLQQGIYVFSLKATDNSGAVNMDSIKVTVNPAPNVPPVANAGASKTITLPVNSAGLDGSLSSDPDGSISSYAWTQVSGPSASTITGAVTSAATASGMIGGLYTFQLTVTDNNGATATASVKITVAGATPQAPPIANAGADQTITLPSNSVVIDGSASSASAGDNIVGYTWAENSGPSTVGVSNGAQNTLNNMLAGVYVFSLTVTDNNGLSSSDNVTITVNKAKNKKPVANPGLSKNLSLPSNSTSLNGSSSYDPDGTISSYNWTEVAGPIPGTLTETGANTAILSLSGLTTGQYTYQLTVVDNSGDSSSGQVNVIVSPAGNILPIANAGSNQSITAPANTVSLDGSASNDPDGTIATFSWVTISGPGSVTISNSNTAKPGASGLTTGVYIFELTVTDNAGATAKDQVTVIVNPKPVLPNQTPVANAGTNQTIAVPDNSASLNGTSSFDPDGTITNYVWTQISGPSSSLIASGNTATATASQLIVGQYVYQLTVTDNNGATNIDQVTITVNPGISKVNLPPVANAGLGDTITLPANTYTLDASASSDPDGTIDTYQWKQVSGPNTAGSSSMSSAQVSLSNLQPGEYEFEVTVTDNAGASSVADMHLTVEQGSTSSDKLVMFPNPAHHYITGKVTSSVTGSVKIYVYDMNGKLVSITEAEKYSDVLYKSFDISGLSPGMYSVQIIIANRKTMVSKFIKY
jgi:ribosomal protein L14